MRRDPEREGALFFVYNGILVDAAQVREIGRQQVRERRISLDGHDSRRRRRGDKLRVVAHPVGVGGRGGRLGAVAAELLLVSDAVNVVNVKAAVPDLALRGLTLGEIVRG